MKPEHAVRLDRTVGRLVIYRFHRMLYRVSGGRLGHRADGRPMLLLTTTGRKTGKERITPLMTFPHDDRFYVVASNAGRDAMPAWFLNLSANPDVRVQFGTRSCAATAHVLDADERARMWPKLTGFYRGWAHYETLTERAIPVVELTPKD